MHRRTLLYAGIVAAFTKHTAIALPQTSQARLIVTEGNSLSSNNPAAYGWPVCWPTRFAAGAFAQQNALKVVNVSVGATCLREAFERAPLFVDPLRELAGWCCVVLIEGGNDLAQVTHSADETYHRTRQYCLDRHAAGWQVLVGTITNRTNLPYVAWWDDCKRYNDMLRDSWHEFADGLVDLAAAPELGADGAGDSTIYFHDRIHYASAGMEIVRAMVEREIARLLPVPAAIAQRATSCLAFPLVAH